MTKPMTLQELKEKARLTPKQIGNAINLDEEGTYPCSFGGGVTHTINVDTLLKAQLDKAYGDAFGEWCKENSVFQVVEGEEPKVDVEELVKGIESRHWLSLGEKIGLGIIVAKTVDYMRQQHKQSLKPVSEILR